MPAERKYIAIDLKSFYASVECVERGLDPLTANLVVADESRTDKTICLAVSPSLKARGIPGRARLFEVLQKVKRSEFIAAVPRMQLYIDYSTRIYQIYLDYVSQEDIHVYSIDEVFIDVTDYLATYRMSAHELAMTIIRDILAKTGITATAGIGTNLYLCKVAMDIVAKHVKADKDGVRIAELDERTYRETLWDYQPLTAFWRVGRGIADKLNRYGLYTMGDVARQSVEDENLLYSLFGVNAELLIDHAWGWEPCTISEIKAYRPVASSMSSGQVLTCPYTAEKARVVVREMADGLAMELLDKRLLTDQVVLTVGYDKDSLTDQNVREHYSGAITKDYYGRLVPKHAHGSRNLHGHTSSAMTIMEAVAALYDEIIDKTLLVRRLNVTANHIVTEEYQRRKGREPRQLDLFEGIDTDADKEREASLEKERRVQETVLEIKKRFGKNSILRGLNFADGATMKERNRQIGGHRA
ncbi:MAG: DNA methylase [Prevotella sp.]|nr:DNA methylase [Prevotella sp.]